MKRGLKKHNFRRWHIIVATLLFVFFANISWSAAEEKVTEGEPLTENIANYDSLQEMIETALASGTSVEALFDELVATGVEESDIICALLSLGVEPYRVIVVALDNGMDHSDVNISAKDCGASQLDVQVGYSMAGETFISQAADAFDKSSNEYLYSPPSPSQ